jgi:type IV secretory pathway TraG/TraD family ATPase VirD4
LNKCVCQLRSGRDFQFSDPSGSISVTRIGLPFEVAKSNIDSDKPVVGLVLNASVRVVAKVESDPNTGQLRLAIKNAVVIKE